MENILRNYQYQTLVQKDNSYLLHYESRYYKIGKVIYEILENSKKSVTIEEICIGLSDKKFSAEQVSEMITTIILPIFNKEKAGKTAPPFMENYWWTGQLLSSKYTSKLSEPLKPLFGKMFTYIFILLSIANIVLYVCNIQLAKSIPPNNEFLQIFITYILLFFILLIHELGHIAAASTEKLKPQEIGFGLYLFMPMMYVNLTDAWTLSKSARTKVNFGGIATQMSANIILFILFNITNNIFILGIIFKLLIVNSSIILINLVPFFKFDGYWILSDIVGIPNLMKESNNIFLHFFIKKSPFYHHNELNNSSKKNYFLLIFTILRILFVLFIVITVCIFSIHTLFKSTIFVMNIPYMKLNAITVIEILKKAVILTIVFIIIKKYCVSIFNLLHKKSSK